MLHLPQKTLRGSWLFSSGGTHETAFSFALSYGLCTLAYSPIKAQEQEYDFYRDDSYRDAFTAGKVPQGVTGATPDEYLISLARAADVNIVADVTPQVNAIAEPPEASPPNISLEGLLFDFAGQQKMHSKRLGERTFLFWRPPQDSAAVANQIVAEHLAADNALPRLTGNEISNLWFEYFKQHGWNGERDVTIDMKIADLPEPLRSGAVVVAQAQLLRLYAGSYDFFVPNTVRKMRLHVGPVTEDARKGSVPYLSWMVPLYSGSYSVGIGRLSAAGGAR